MDLSPALLPPALPPAAALACWLFFVNVGTYGLIRLDRRRAAMRARRMGESPLLWLALLGGWPGLLLALGEGTGVHHSPTFRGWLRGAVAAQVLLAGLAVLPQGSLLAAAEKALQATLDARGDSARKASRITLDSDRGIGGLSNVVTLSSDP